MQVEEMSDFFPQKEKRLKERCNTTDKTSWHKRIFCQVDQTLLQKKKSFSRISQDDVQAIISEVVADDVQKNFYKIYCF